MFGEKIISKWLGKESPNVWWKEIFWIICKKISEWLGMIGRENPNMNNC
jgi:hypothetical protein